MRIIDVNFNRVKNLKPHPQTEFNGGEGNTFNLRNGPCFACVYQVMGARGKLGEHERSVEWHEAKPGASLASRVLSQQLPMST